MHLGDLSKRESWRGLLEGWPRGAPSASLAAPIRTSTSGTHALLGLADNGRQYWVKACGNPQGDLVLTTEQIVSAVGLLLEAPVRPVVLLDIPESLAGWLYGPGLRLEAGVAHASEHLASCEECEDFAFRKHDHNSTRQPALVALWDLCMGYDAQWLFDHSDDRSIWSFDHGWWLSGPDWSGDLLSGLVDRPWEWEGSLTGMSGEQFIELAERVELLTPDELLGAVAAVPLAWDVPDWELETVAWLLYNRKIGVARRLRVSSARVLL